MSKKIHIGIDSEKNDLLYIGDSYLARYDFQNALNCYKNCSAADPLVQKDLLARTSLLEGWQNKSISLLKRDTDILLSVSKILQDHPLAGQLFVGAVGIVSYGRTVGLLKDERLRMVSEKHSHLSPIHGWQWNLETVVWAIKHALHLPGDFVELGTFKGHTARVMVDYFDFAVIPKKWYLYDTFDGIPDDQIDSDHWRQANRIYKGTFSFEEVSDAFSSFENVSVVKGRVPEILKEVCPEQISFLHVDLNNATAERQALDFLYDGYLVPGGVIIFDDYGFSVAEAQQVAADEWADTKGLKILELPTGQGLLLKPT